MNPANNRKNEHVSLAMNFFQESSKSDFDALHYVHHSFPQMSVEEVNLSTSFASFRLDFPFYINAMTGGSDWTKKINKKLATVAHETGIAMSTGSVSAALKDPSVKDSFTIIREVNPAGLVFANLGTGQTVENAKKAVDLLKADALQIHINAPQELIMPEGDRDFSNWLEQLSAITAALDVPIIAKEVGFGMSRETIESILATGVKTIDISGKGGTNFAQIENYRRKTNKIDYLENWGQSSVISLLEAQEFLTTADILASGGIRHPLDIVKALSLGAKAVGISSLILNMMIKDGVDETISQINDWKENLKSIMTLVGKKTVSDLQQTDFILTGEVKDWCLARGIDYTRFAVRSTTN
ncbi:isopentenyl-diphosphate delta-isomerase [Carnobacterium iners]|uniref:Isopentenyl-diphosphate delta-isomerase n=1 Tax=Carnobacterium iners TaxID=1073423 RepID=A0A1X7N349_9LACT|nr:type 2 isopentenyl-diphosphate Delta-isomerase [Carnobacterium iners]SEK62657.1 isopentenyl-diphosphate delta-isomerase [Carnobacterium iners]SMH31722.1 isopentenyl-diphosphate delta-isomerase [Carnobacterium iners]